MCLITFRPRTKGHAVSRPRPVTNTVRLRTNTVRLRPSHETKRSCITAHVRPTESKRKTRSSVTNVWFPCCTPAETFLSPNPFTRRTVPHVWPDERDLVRPKALAENALLQLKRLVSDNRRIWVSECYVQPGGRSSAPSCRLRRKPRGSCRQMSGAYSLRNTKFIS